MSCEFSDVVTFDLGPLIQSQVRIANLKVLIAYLLLSTGLECKPTSRKSWDENLLMWLDWTLGPSFKVKCG